MKTSDITDEVMLAALAATSGRCGVPVSTIWDVEAEMPAVPRKLVLSKLRNMLRRRVIEGCGCGCRGDFRRPDTNQRNESQQSE